MAKIHIGPNTGYTPIPEGPATFKVVAATYDPDFGKVEVELITETGKKQTERFGLLNAQGEVNEGGNNAFGYFSRAILDDFETEDIDIDDLVGRYFTATVKHDVKPHRDDPTRTVTWIKLNDIKTAKGFAATAVKSTTKKPSLDDLL